MVPRPLAQVPLFPGNRGCGVRDRGAAVTQMDLRTASLAEGEHATYLGRCVVVRLDGVKLSSPNTSRFTTRGGAMAQASAIKKLRRDVKLHIISALGLGHVAPSRVVITRLSFGELDRDNAWSSAKPVFDGVADAFTLANDRELQKNGDVQQCKCKRGTSGVVIELFFSV